MSNNTKLKVLLLGPAPGDSEVIAFCNKVNALHKSKAGPFDVAFGVGTFAMPLTQSEACSKLQQLPIPVYLQDAVLQETTTENDSNSDEIRQLIEPNVFAFPVSVANLFNITVRRNNTGVSLVVASCPRTLRMDNLEAIKPLMDKVSHVSYVGCDFLLTSHWPQGMENLANHDANPQIQKLATQNATYDVAEVALRARARYHIAPASLSANNNNAVYWQSPPFRHLAATTSTQSPKHVGRLIALCNVSAKKPPNKEQKFVHALGIVPLHAMPTHELMAQSQGGGAAPCPFTDDSYQKDNANSTIMTSNTQLSEAQVRRILAENNSGEAVGSGRWNLNKKRKKMENASNDAYDPNAPVDPTNTTLFVHGLHRDVTQQLQSASSPLLLEAFSKFGVAKIRRPPNAATTSFAFLEFDSHDAAKNCLETLGGSTTVNGVQLTLKWGTHSQQNKSGNFEAHHKRPRLTEADAKDSSSLYFRLPPRYLSEDYEGVSEKIRKWMESTLEEVLSDGSDAKVTAADEPALQVKLRHTPTQGFGFLDFASHAAASMALATLTGSTDGGKVECPDSNNNNNNNEDDTTKDNTVKADPDVTSSNNNVKEKPEATTSSDEKPISDSNNRPTIKEETNEKILDDNKIWGLALHWAHAKVETKADKLIADADSNFKFRRQHFPADARQDCWFCLASDGCEKHLITGVYHQCYAALPKGGIHKGHVLLIPVAHSSQGAFFDPTVSQEIKALQLALRKHASEQYDMDMFIFERAIQTKGGYHTHVQCVPVERGLSVKLESTLRAQAKANGMDLREIQSPDLDISALLRNQQEDSDSSGYFYAEVPVDGSRLECKRFLYQVPADDVADDASGHSRHPGSRVPIQFGREVIAAVMGKPELAHWKSCVVDREEETKLASDLRESFQKYYIVGDDD